MVTATKVIKNVLEVQGMEARILNPERHGSTYREALPLDYSTIDARAREYLSDKRSPNLCMPNLPCLTPPEPLTHRADK